jgi:D-glycero-alpha-D-manno-heptose-7-phosphate kinase
MYIVSRTPLRVSLFGGGTDYPSYFERKPGAVLGFAIDKYIYISLLELPAFSSYRFRASYSRIETVNAASELQHPMIRALLQHYEIQGPLDISAQADLLASSGLGSSSAFTVGMINALSALTGFEKTKYEMAREAIYAEQVLLKENVGVQDQLHASFGGINRFNFKGTELSIEPIRISGSDLRLLTDWMILINTGITRRATEVVGEQITKTKAGALDSTLASMSALVDEAQGRLEGGFDEEDVRALAKLLDESWQLKKGLSSSITGSSIDDLYALCLKSGALGGKLCGAGSGGFLLMIVPPPKRRALYDAVGQENCIDFRIDTAGSTVIHQTHASLSARGEHP